MSARMRWPLLLVPVLVMSGCWGGPNHTLGVHDGTLAACPDSPNCVHTGMRHPDGTRGMFADTRVPRGELMGRLAAVVSELPRAKIITQNGDYLHAEIRSQAWRFVDDLEVFITYDNEVIVRSASRVGKGDLGVNVARVEDLRSRWQAAGAIR